jgi:hypothetical protein
MSRLTVVNLPSPGSLGLNTEDAGVDAPTDYAKVATNCVVSKDKRLAARKSFEAYSPLTSFTGTVKSIFPTIDVDGTKTYIWGAGNKVYAGYPTWTDITGALSITDDDWKFCSLQSTVFATQQGHTPAAWRRIAGVWTAQSITMPSDMSTDKPDVCLAAFGRVFTANGDTIKNKIWFSEELNPLNFTTAGAGFLDLSTVLFGGDNIVGLSALGNRLVISCTNQTVLYTFVENGTPFLVLDEVIKGVGCVSRDSIVNTGTDLIWLADQGLVSLGRLVQNSGQLPMGDVSFNVHTAIQTETDGVADKTTIKACWWAAEKTYLILFKESGRIYSFNLKVNQNEAPVCTLWNNIKDITCLTSDYDRNLLFGGTNKWLIYQNYGSSADSYQFSYYSGYMDFKDPSAFKFLKSISFLVKTSNNQPTVVKWAFDYSDQYESNAFDVGGVGGTVAEYNIAEYGIAEYSSGPGLQDLRSIAGRSGQYLQFGIETEINGNEFVVYRCEVQVTAGKSY